jgi:hypothetical protein
MSVETKVDALELINSLSKYLDDEDFMEEQFRNKFSLWKRELNVLKAFVKDDVTGALFEVGEYVLKGNTVVEINSRSFTETRGWVYAISYRNIDKEKLNVSYGGSSCWWNEEDFKKLEDSFSKLIIKKHKLEKEERIKENELKHIRANLGKLEFSLDIIRGNLQ